MDLLPSKEQLLKPKKFARENSVKWEKMYYKRVYHEIKADDFEFEVHVGVNDNHSKSQIFIGTNKKDNEEKLM